jgi:chemotaxis protein methyltransferase CheR
MIKDEIFKFFGDYIFQNSGMVYLIDDYYRLETRLNDLVRIFEVSSVDDVYEMYKKNITPDMKAVLINISTNNETYFFRDVKPFTIFSKNIMPELLSKVGFGPLKVWSAASSTGQEAFSMLMSVQNTSNVAGFSRLSIFASDISSDALAKAMKGIYNGLDVQRGLPIAQLMKYFTQLENGSWQISKEILSKVKFSEFNLLKGSFPINMYHVIFCRYVLIYQEKENKTKILKNIYDALVPGGYLFLGNGESLIGIDSQFERVTIDGYTIFQKKSI